MVWCWQKLAIAHPQRGGAQPLAALGCIVLVVAALCQPIGVAYAAEAASSPIAGSAWDTQVHAQTAPFALLTGLDRAQSTISKTHPRIETVAFEGCEATSASVSGDEKQTVFRLQLTKGVTAEVFTLGNPFRVIVDLPGVGFRLPEGTGVRGEGLVSAFRYGQFAEGKSRIVLDATQPVLIRKANMTALPGGSGVELAIVLEPTSQQSFGDGTGTQPAEKAQPAEPAATPPLPAGNTKTRPIIMIDAGHGGIDGGAVGAGNLIEKNVVLGVARELQQQLARSGRYDVRMTRTTDVFISLDKRLKLSRESASDLFISLHADSIADQQFVQQVRGATVYTLSERASDEQARRMAEKENASDLIAGLDASSPQEGEEVRGILIDLMKRETANYSADFSSTLVGKLKQNIRLSRDPQRSAAFKVLKQTHAPSVLLELGYMSHDEDQKLLGSPAWQKSAAKSISEAVDAFFAKRDTGAASLP